MLVIISQDAQYVDYSFWDIPDLPSDWEHMDHSEKSTWVVLNGEFSKNESEYQGGGVIIDIEVEGESNEFTS
jgi:hypothetical protein